MSTLHDPRRFLALLLVNRQMCAEAAPVFYGGNVFRSDGSSMGLCTLLPFLRGIGWDRVDMLRRVEFDLGRFERFNEDCLGALQMLREAECLRSVRFEVLSQEVLGTEAWGELEVGVRLFEGRGVKVVVANTFIEEVVVGEGHDHDFVCHFVCCFGMVGVRATWEWGWLGGGEWRAEGSRMMGREKGSLMG